MHADVSSVHDAAQQNSNYDGCVLPGCLDLTVAGMTDDWSQSPTALLMYFSQWRMCRNSRSSDECCMYGVPIVRCIVDLQSHVSDMMRSHEAKRPRAEKRAMLFFF